jgi:hypothetical protein
MKDLILFILATSGLTWTITLSKLFKPIREFFTSNKKIFGVGFLNNITNCGGCFGFWSGMANCMLVYGKLDIKIICYGFAGTIISLLVIALYKFLCK